MEGVIQKFARLVSSISRPEVSLLDACVAFNSLLSVVSAMCAW